MAAELIKQGSWSDSRPSLFHFRTHGGREVDLVLEDARGRVVGKAFVQGVLLYTGTAALPFGPKLAALPLGALWAG